MTTPKVSECVCADCNCVPFIGIGSKAAGEPRTVTVACKCKSVSVPSHTNDKRGEVSDAFDMYMHTDWDHMAVRHIVRVER